MIRLIAKFISSTNYLINSIDRKTATNIKHSFYLLVFVLLIISVLYGYKLGKENAKIKRKPISEITNDVFNIDMKKEKSEGDFTGILESEIINESTNPNLIKEKFPTREKLKADLDQGIIDDTRDKKINPSTEVDNRNQLIDENYNNQSIEKSDVRSLDEINKKEDIRGFPDETNNSRSKKSKLLEDFNEKNEKTKAGPMDMKPGKEFNLKQEEGILEN